MTYTVCGYYTDNHQVFCSHVEDAAGVHDAQFKAVSQLLEDNDGMEPSNIAVVSIFEGAQMDKSESDSVVFGNDVVKGGD